jgi:hypothetical protein
MVIIFSITLCGQTIPSTFFGNQLTAAIIDKEPWPSVPISALRLWDSGVQWADINTAPGVYDFRALDAWLAMASAHHVEVLYTFGKTPAWASSQPSDGTCGYYPGACDPPKDLGVDGGGTDEYFTSFVRALVFHAAARIRWWELGNEMGNPHSWRGNVAQTLRMSADASQIIRSLQAESTILSPSIVISSSVGQRFLQSYLIGGGARYFDMAAFHGYIQREGMPLSPHILVNYVSSLRDILASRGLNVDIVDTEASWGKPQVSSPPFIDQQMQAGFVAIYYLLHLSTGIKRLYWYEYNNQSFGTMWAPNSTNLEEPGTLLPAGVAFKMIQHWLTGARLLHACAIRSEGISACQFLLRDGTSAEFVWAANEVCIQGACTTTRYQPAPQYATYVQLDGRRGDIVGTVEVGYCPILLKAKLDPDANSQIKVQR